MASATDASSVIHRRIPPEVMSTIFEMNSDTSGSMREIRESIAYPLVLSSVCHDWLAIARSTPRLWTFVQIRRENSTLTKAHQRLAISYLSRSTALPCYVYIAIESQAITSMRAISIVNELIRPILPRVKKLHILGYPLFLRAAVALFPLHCPVLDAFHFGRLKPVDLGFRVPEVDIPDAAFSECPSLRFLELYDVSPRKSDSSDSLKMLSSLRPLCDIKLLNISMDYRDVYTLISLCKDTLESCTIITDTSSTDPTSPTSELTTLTLPNLWYFYLSLLCDAPLLDSLTLPALRCLHLITARDMDGRYIHGLCKRSKFDLTAFVASGFTFDTDELCKILADNPNLGIIKMDLTNIGNMERLFRHLAGHNEAGHKYPALVTLVVSPIEATLRLQDYKAIMDFLVSRPGLWVPHACLRVQPLLSLPCTITVIDAIIITTRLRWMKILMGADVDVRCLCQTFSNLPVVCWCVEI